MAGNPDLACLLVGMGVDELSMAASAVPEVKQRIRSVAIADLKELSQEVLTLTTSQEIRELMAKRVPRLIRRRSARGSRGAREVEARSREW
jgi:phosphoenolpyruvate-protein kinase (PTS system EI component)